ncbi:LPO_1073/Vpar_1526 family protein [Bacteroides congonensis]|uniref:LPO_1073/Vpar_1526 family protein n=1 Tax=Bacteroides congonensis TaxID=1871006 RepID=UPI001898780A|nr:LPO_1073/Vpar_1526 family protein [Bacteroides congonensis]
MNTKNKIAYVVLLLLLVSTLIYLCFSPSIISWISFLSALATNLAHFFRDKNTNMGQVIKFIFSPNDTDKINDKKDPDPVYSNSDKMKAHICISDKEYGIINQYYNYNVKEIDNLIEEKLSPVLKRVSKESIQNTYTFLSKLFAKLDKQKIDINKIENMSPDVYLTLRKALYDNVQKISRVDSDVLISLLVEKIKTDTVDFESVLISESILVMSKITKNHVAFLAFLYFLKIKKLPPELCTISEKIYYRFFCNLDKMYEPIVNDASDFFLGGDQEIPYLEFLKLIERDPLKKAISFTKYLASIYKLKIPFLYSESDLDNLLKLYAPHVRWIDNQYTRKQLSIYSLTPIGEKIAKCYLDNMKSDKKYEC